tara:strand:+ start:40 stop:228 length:189 start_codon:yes stop_codon:yes gene_type:complete
MTTLNTVTPTNEFNYDDQDGTYWAEFFTPESDYDSEPWDLQYDDVDPDDELFEQLTNEGEQS